MFEFDFYGGGARLTDVDVRHRCRNPARFIRQTNFAKVIASRFCVADYKKDKYYRVRVFR